MRYPLHTYDNLNQKMKGVLDMTVLKLNQLSTKLELSDSVQDEILEDASQILIEAIKSSDKDAILQLVGALANRGIQVEKLLNKIFRAV